MDLTPVTAPVHGVVVNIDVSTGQSVPEGAPLLVLESMKMEYVVVAPVGGVVREIASAPGEVVGEDDVLISIEEGAVAAVAAPAGTGPGERSDLAEVLRRHEAGLDAARPDAVRRRGDTGHRTARENVADLCETFTEYGALAIAAQRARRSLDELIEKTWRHAGQEALRDLVPQDRKRIYDVRAVIETVADTGSVLELRQAYGRGIVTALARVEGMPVGLVANSPAHLGGAIDADGADKMSRFMKLCDAFGLPLVSLCDTPGFMVGPEAERTATVRHFGRMFVTGANLSVPLVMIILRKAYGLGAQAMAGGSLKVPVATVAWPTGELGGMGLEGAVRLGFRRELAAAEDPDALFEDLVARSYERGKALSAATVYEIDDVIDPADTRRWIRTALRDVPRGERRIPLDTW